MPAIDFQRIRDVVDVEAMQRAKITFVGCGGSSTLVCDTVRNGIGAVDLIDSDSVEASNVARQEHYLDAVGTPKVEALRRVIARINPACRVNTFRANFCHFTDAEIDAHFGDTDLFVFGTDNHAAQSRGNQVALRLRKRGVWIGLYEGGRAGEVVFWKPGITSCYRCMCAARYAAFDGGHPNPPSEGATIFAVHMLDAIAGMLAIGLLTEGADNRFGRLIGQLGDRNFIQLKMDPEWGFNGRDVIRERLGVSTDNDAYFSFNSVALRDPDNGIPACLDCVQFLGRTT